MMMKIAWHARLPNQHPSFCALYKPRCNLFTRLCAQPAAAKHNHQDERLPRETIYYAERILFYFLHNLTEQSSPL